MAAVITQHIHLDERGVAWINDTNTKVIEVALDHIAHGWSAAEIHEQHPHLSLAQIHAALAHYFDHQAEFDQRIRDQLAEVGALAAAATPSPLLARMRTQRPKR